MADASSTNAILSVRVNPHERALLQEAADQAQTTLSDFIRRKALEAAEAEVLKRADVTIPAEDWARFEAWLDRPAEPADALRTLARRTPSWQR